MSYTTCATALLTLVRAYNSGATFTTATSAEEDYQLVFNQEQTGAIITMWGDSEEADFLDGRGAQGKRQARHSIAVILAEPIGTRNDADVKASLHTIREALIAYLRPYARLNNTSGVKRAELVMHTKDRLIGPTPDRGTHWISALVYRVWEEFTVTYTESFS